MSDQETDKEPKKKNHALRKLVGAVAIAGVTYAAEKYIASRKEKKDGKAKKSSK